MTITYMRISIVYITFVMYTQSTLEEPRRQTNSLLNQMKKYAKLITNTKHEDLVLIVGSEVFCKHAFKKFLTGRNQQLTPKKADATTSINNRVKPVYICSPRFNYGGVDNNKISAYFTQLVQNSSKILQFVFPVSNAVVSKGNLMKLLKYATNLIPNMDKYKRSILFVVIQGKSNQYIKKDDAVIRGTVEVLHKLQRRLENSLAKNIVPLAAPFLTNAVKFLDLLLVKHNDEYPNIATFRPAVKKRKLLNKWLSHALFRPPGNRLVTRKRIRQRILPGYTQTIKKKLQQNRRWFANDEKVAVRKLSTRYRLALDKEPKIDVLSNILAIEVQILNYYYAQETRRYDLNAMADMFQLGYDTFSTTSSFIQNCVEPKKLAMQIMKNVDELHIEIPKKNIYNILKQDESFNFFWAVGGQSKHATPQSTRAFGDLLEYLDESKKWYKFLVNLYETLSDYKMQKRIKQNDVANLQFPNELEKGGQIKLQEFVEFQQFLDHIQADTQAYDKIKHLKINDMKLQALKDVLDATLFHNKAEFSCATPNKLLIQSHYIFLSEIDSYLTMHRCPEKPRFIEIFALHKIFIDKTFNRTGEELQLSIISPTWEVVSDVAILLEGKPGSTPRTPKTVQLPGSNGQKGKSGSRGGPPGTFLGVGMTFVNGNHLTISVNGGRGGQGQDGGDGADGQDGADPPDPRQKHVSLPQIWDANNFAYVSKSKYFCHVLPNLDEVKTYYVVGGKMGGKGGDGGDGGKEGRGGIAGTASLIGFNSHPQSFISASKGEDGCTGLGGRGGKGGKHGQNLRAIHSVYVANPACNFTVVEYYWAPNVTANADAGKDGVFKMCLQHDTEETVKFVHPANTINNYKLYLSRYLTNSSMIQRAKLVQFLDQMYNDTRVAKLYDTLGLVDDLQILESQFFKLNQSVLVAPVCRYQSLLRRIVEYAQNPREHENSIEHKTVLSYLYTATLSKISFANLNGEYTLNLNIMEYMDYVLKDIQELDMAIKPSEMQRESLKYRPLMDLEIKEAAVLIDERVVPEIEAIAIETDSNILANEKLTENTLIQKLVANILKVAGHFLSFVGPHGTAASLTIADSASVLEVLALTNQSAPIGIQLLSKGTSNSSTKLTEDIREQNVLLDLQLEDVLKALKSLKQKVPQLIGYDEIIEKTTDVKEYLRNTRETLQVCNYEEIARYELAKREIDAALEKLQANVAEYSENVEHMRNIIRCGILGLKIYNAIRNNRATIKQFAEAIAAANDKIQILKRFENDTYSMMTPMCRNIANYMSDIKETINKKSPKIHVDDWNPHISLECLRARIQGMLGQFGEPDDAADSIADLDEAMSLLGTFYMRVENYQSQMQLAKYVENIGSNKAYINSTALQKAISNLTVIIQSNLVLRQFKKAINAFNQYVFPFTHYYHADFTLTAGVTLEPTTQSISSLVFNSTRLIKLLQETLADSKYRMVNKYDNYVHTKVAFNDKERKPFIVWHNEDYQNEIETLLAGKEITLDADIMEGLNKTAIKFNVIGIKMKSVDAALQYELDKQLEHFEIVMTHLGNSQYRCGEDFYIIRSENQTFSYYFKQMSGEPVNRNMVYEKIKNSRPILSPYATWTMKLNSISGGNFKALNKYKNDVDLQLVGRGQYVERGIFEEEVC